MPLKCLATAAAHLRFAKTRYASPYDNALCAKQNDSIIIEAETRKAGAELKDLRLGCRSSSEACVREEEACAQSRGFSVGFFNRQTTNVPTKAVRCGTDPKGRPIIRVRTWPQAEQVGL